MSEDVVTPPPGTATPRRRGIWHEDPGESRIPRPDPGASLLRRSASMRLRGEKLPAGPSSRRPASYFPVITETSEQRHNARQPNRQHSISTSNLSRPQERLTPFTPSSSPAERVEVDEDDLDSLRSFGSVFSTMSCDHAYIARNGTTFSGRHMKYVVHCSSHAGETDDYLTPTQRATRQIRRLKALLKQAHADLEDKNTDIFRLTKEVVELRLFKGSLSADTVDEARSYEKVEVENSKQQQNGVASQVEEVHVNEGMNVLDLPASLADSGHFEDMAMSVYSKDSLMTPHSPMYNPVLLNKETTGLEDREGERRRIVNMYEKRIEDMQRNNVDENQEMKEKHNDKVDNLLLRLSKSNERFTELRADYDVAQGKLRDLEKEVESLRKGVSDQEDRHQSMYLKMYVKGQEAARFEHADQVLEFAHQAPSRVSVPELLKQLQATENELENIKAMYRRIVESRSGKADLDPEVTLQFLKSAIYYFFTDRENTQGHLNAIESILGYNDSEKRNIEKAYRLHAK